MTVPSSRIIGIRELSAMLPLSRSQLWRLEKNGEFPRRIKLGKRRVGWRLSDIEQWIEARRAAASEVVLDKEERLHALASNIRVTSPLSAGDDNSG